MVQGGYILPVPLFSETNGLMVYPEFDSVPEVRVGGRVGLVCLEHLIPNSLEQRWIFDNLYHCPRGDRYSVSIQ